MNKDRDSNEIPRLLSHFANFVMKRPEIKIPGEAVHLILQLCYAQKKKTQKGLYRLFNYYFLAV